jgi:aminoglycoside 3-N-acetyltransferase
MATASGSPFEKLIQVGGKVLLLGSPLDSVTVLHYSENVARVANKLITCYQEPMLINGQRTWVDIEEFDTSKGIAPWPAGDYFKAIVREYIESGQAQAGQVGSAQSYLLDARSLHEFAVQWMESNL